MDFVEITKQLLLFWLFLRSSKKYQQKEKYRGNTIACFFKAFASIRGGKMKQVLLAYDPREITYYELLNIWKRKWFLMLKKASKQWYPAKDYNK